MNDVQSIFYKAVTAIANKKTFAEVRVGCGVEGKMSDSTSTPTFPKFSRPTSTFPNFASPTLAPTP